MAENEVERRHLHNSLTIWQGWRPVGAAKVKAVGTRVQDFRACDQLGARRKSVEEGGGRRAAIHGFNTSGKEIFPQRLVV